MGLLNPLLLLLAGAAAVPLLLHLLQRHQGPRVIFPALRYLRRAEKELFVMMRITLPDETLALRNSGTSARCLAGICATIEGLSVLDGDGSLRRRPMLRVVAPQRQPPLMLLLLVCQHRRSCGLTLVVSQELRVTASPPRAKPIEAPPL